MIDLDGVEVVPLRDDEIFLAVIVVIKKARASTGKKHRPADSGAEAAM